MGDGLVQIVDSAKPTLQKSVKSEVFPSFDVTVQHGDVYFGESWYLVGSKNSHYRGRAHSEAAKVIRYLLNNLKKEFTILGIGRELSLKHYVGDTIEASRIINGNSEVFEMPELVRPELSKIVLISYKRKK